MKRSSKRVLGIVAASVLIIGASSGVLARGGYGYGHGPGWGAHRGMMGGPAGMSGAYGGGPGWMGGADPAVTGQRLDQLKSSLGITPEQETAWNNYATAVTTRSALMNGHRQAMFSGTVSPDQMQDFRQSGWAQRQQLGAATRDLYGVLTPQQRARAGGLMGGRGGCW